MAEEKPYRDFFQDPPRLGNAFVDDSFLQSLLKRLITDGHSFKQIEVDLNNFGRRCSTDLLDLAAAQELHQPWLEQYDSWGSRVDRLHTCAAWKAQHGVAAEEGIVAHGYERKHGAASRLLQFAKIYLYTPSSGLYNCPLAMTDGAARLCELLLGVAPGSEQKPPPGALVNMPESTRDVLREALRRLTARDGKTFWTSGQWMTERGGGSDVAGGTSTVAKKQPDGSYKLYGFKWFTSATDSHMTITLARIVDENGRTTPGTRGLSCFFMRVKEDDGSLNNIHIHKLKQKLGTKQLPTAELELVGSRALLLSEPGRGVALITTLVNITRVYNAIASCGFMRRMMLLMRDYAHRRTVFGKKLADNPMHLETLAECEVQVRAATAFSFDVAARLGRAEIPQFTQAEDVAMLRLLTPLVKLYTGKQAVAMATEGLESFGGQGYIEDSKLPRMLRDVQVLAIWEGTTNVLSHDLLRVMTTSKGKAWTVFKAVVQGRIDAARRSLSSTGFSADYQQRFSRAIDAWSHGLSDLERYLGECMSGGKEAALAMESLARQLAFGMSRVYIASTLAIHAADTKQIIDWVVLERWIIEGDTRQSTAISSLVPATLRSGVVSSASTRLSESRELALDIDPRTHQPRACGNVNPDGTPRSKL